MIRRSAILVGFDDHDASECAQHLVRHQYDATPILDPYAACDRIRATRPAVVAIATTLHVLHRAMVQACARAVGAETVVLLAAPLGSSAADVLERACRRTSGI